MEMLPLMTMMLMVMMIDYFADYGRKMMDNNVEIVDVDVLMTLIIENYYYYYYDYDDYFDYYWLSLLLWW